MNSHMFQRLFFPTSLAATLYGGTVLFRETRYKTCPNKKSMENKNVVITGANSGIGYETTKELASRGANVVMACRHMGKCKIAAKKLIKQTNNENIVCRFVDLANLDSVEAFAAEIRKELPHIDVLINNAGVMKPRLPKADPLTDDGFERQLGINHLGHFLLTNLLLDRLSNGDLKGRVVNVTSIAYKKAIIDFDDINKENDKTIEKEERLSQLYYQSKLANLLFTDYLHRKLQLGEITNVTANCYHPGVVKTNIGRYSSAPAYAIGQIFVEIAKFVVMKSPRQGAQTGIYLATDDGLKDDSGKFFDDCSFVAPTCDECEQEQSEQLWLMSEKWTQLKERLERVMLNESEESSIKSENKNILSSN